MLRIRMLLDEISSGWKISEKGGVLPRTVLHNNKIVCYEIMAEEVGFEPTVPCGTTVFKTAAFDHSATPPTSPQDQAPTGKRGRGQDSQPDAP